VLVMSFRMGHVSSWHFGDMAGGPLYIRKQPWVPVARSQAAERRLRQGFGSQPPAPERVLVRLAAQAIRGAGKQLRPVDQYEAGSVSSQSSGICSGAMSMSAFSLFSMSVMTRRLPLHPASLLHRIDLRQSQTARRVRG
jgi:hypothetical protein